MDAGYWTATPVTSMRVSLITTQFTSDHFGSNRLMSRGSYMCSAPVLSAAGQGSGYRAHCRPCGFYHTMTLISHVSSIWYA
jgi:hypothetical protein